MPHRTRPMTSLLLFMGLNLVLVNTVSPVYDFVCFLPYWERRVNIICSLPLSIQLLLAYWLRSNLQVVVSFRAGDT
ncbi:hypothetical protein ACMD2_26182 [Ananas comosus]|uniref:Uncharacterized protein n=1 Tax=Ananas comosus TaxID=4615 RepID=A0A199VPA9_ANACO|nr:hypothetical protein ACMD2_26182 [Ananas comosus]